MTHKIGRMVLGYIYYMCRMFSEDANSSAFDLGLCSISQISNPLLPGSYPIYVVAHEEVEFVEGLLNLCLLDMPIATIQTLKFLQLIRASLSQIQSKLQAPHHAAKLSQRWT